MADNIRFAPGTVPLQGYIVHEQERILMFVGEEACKKLVQQQMEPLCGQARWEPPSTHAFVVVNPDALQDHEKRSQQHHRLLYPRTAADGLPNNSGYCTGPSPARRGGSRRHLGAVWVRAHGKAWDILAVCTNHRDTFTLPHLRARLVLFVCALAAYNGAENVTARPDGAQERAYLAQAFGETAPSAPTAPVRLTVRRPGETWRRSSERLLAPDLLEAVRTNKMLGRSLCTVEAHAGMSDCSAFHEAAGPTGEVEIPEYSSTESDTNESVDPVVGTSAAPIPHLTVVTWNLCWEFMDGAEPAGSQLTNVVKLCKAEADGPLNRCAQRAARFIAKHLWGHHHGEIDFWCLQEVTHGTWQHMWDLIVADEPTASFQFVDGVFPNSRLRSVIVYRASRWTALDGQGATLKDPTGTRLLQWQRFRSTAMADGGLVVDVFNVHGNHTQTLKDVRARLSRREARPPPLPRSAGRGSPPGTRRPPTSCSWRAT